MEALRSRQVIVVVCVLSIGVGAAERHPSVRPVPSRTLYVDDSAIGTHNGTSWTDAFVHLQDALRSARRSDRIRVAQGVYKPDQGNGISPGDREASFYVVSGITLAGGYAGLEGPDPDDRDIARYETILSGDLAGNDDGDVTTLGDNSLVVVSSLNNDASTFLEGFTITGGWNYSGPGITCLASDLCIQRCTVSRNRTKSAAGDGAGVYTSGGDPVLVDCVFKDNFAWRDGAGFYSEDGNPVLEGCLFENNTAEGGGGGLYFRDGVVTLEHCIFRGNSAREGGGMAGITGDGSVCVDCQFLGNTASGAYGGSGGGAFVRSSGAMTFRDCLFEDNSADDGGGLSAGGALVLNRCRFVMNEAASAAGAFDCTFGAPVLTDCLFDRNVAHGDGGAVRCRTGLRGPAVSTFPGAAFVRCRFTGNRVFGADGGALYNDNTNVTFTNCLLVGNDADAGGAIHSRGGVAVLTCCTLAHNRAIQVGGLSDEAGGCVLDHCIVWGNDGQQLSGVAVVTYSDVGGGWPGDGNIDVDPLFTSPGFFSSVPKEQAWIDGDYHLKSQAGRWDPTGEKWVQDDQTSLCIDAGDPSGPIGDESFPNGGIANLGAYGGTIEASRSYFGDPVCDVHMAGDINGDCRVDFEDLYVVLTQWSEGTPPEIAR